MSDQLARAVTRDGYFKICAVEGTQTVETARQYHHTTPVASAALGRLLCAGLMMGTGLKEEAAKMTLQLKGDGPLGTVLVAADGGGRVKGYAANPMVDLPLRDDGKLNVGAAVGQGTLSVIKDLGLKEPYVGQVAIQTGEIGDDLAYYFMQSEQVPSVVGLGVLVERDYSIGHAGGFLIQVMPDCDDKSLTKLENSVRGLMSVTDMLAQGMESEDMIHYIMLGFDVEILEKSRVGYHCDCSRERMERAIISLGRQEVEDIIREQGQAEIVCHFCNTAYRFSGEELGKMKEQCSR